MMGLMSDDDLGFSMDMHYARQAAKDAKDDTAKLWRIVDDLSRRVTELERKAK